MLFKELSEIGKRIIQELDNKAKIYIEKENQLKQKVLNDITKNIHLKESPESKDNENK